MDREQGVLATSLDFELYWGTRDLQSLEICRQRLANVRTAIAEILNLFGIYEIHATWATVGLLFVQNRKELLEVIPKVQPEYHDATLYPYQDVDRIRDGEEEEPCCFAHSTIEAIRAIPHQEIGTHTFSHYYCREDGQTVDSFSHDLRAAQRLAARRGIELRSIVFPRNQVNTHYLSACEYEGISCYRGSGPHWLYTARKRSSETLARKIGRALDTFTPVFGRHSVPLDRVLNQSRPFNIPGTRHFRPALMTNQFLKRRAIRQIMLELEECARKRRLYHLWFHPEDFACDTSERLDTLRRILDCFSSLRIAGRLKSLNMAELADVAEQRSWQVSPGISEVSLS